MIMFWAKSEKITELFSVNGPLNLDTDDHHLRYQFIFLFEYTMPINTEIVVIIVRIKVFTAYPEISSVFGA